MKLERNGFVAERRERLTMNRRSSDGSFGGICDFIVALFITNL